MPTTISLRNVTKKYRVDEQRTVVPVNNIDLNVERGEFIIIVGRSGSGKTTLLNLAAGLIKPTTGEVLLEGTNLQSLSDKKLSLLRNKQIGFIFQYPSLLPSLTALENVAMPCFLSQSNGSDDPHVRAATLLENMGLNDRKNALPKNLSSGEQRRVVIARALVNRPEILLADEPTSDLDARTELEIMTLLRDTNKSGVTILMVTHGLELLPYANRTLTMEKGNLQPTSA